MAKVIFRFPYILKPGPRKAKADELRKQWNENNFIVIDSDFDVTIVKDDDDLIIEGDQWIPLTQEAVDMDLKDHHYYLIADKRFDTPMKAKFHSDPLAHFELTILVSTPVSTNDVVYVYDIDGQWGDACPITHYMELPSLPWEKNN